VLLLIIFCVLVNRVGENIFTFFFFFIHLIVFFFQSFYFHLIFLKRAQRAIIKLRKQFGKEENALSDIYPLLYLQQIEEMKMKTASHGRQATASRLQLNYINFIFHDYF
jgi:hypothetical protein